MNSAHDFFCLYVTSIEEHKMLNSGKNAHALVTASELSKPTEFNKDDFSLHCGIFVYRLLDFMDCSDSKLLPVVEG